jgi:hypothetical protein
MPHYARVLGLLAAFAVTVSAQTAADKKEWRQLFNGKTLDGWTPKISGYNLGENYANTFRAENGVLKAAYDKYEGPFNNRFGHLFYKEKFSHYIIAVEYRFAGEQAKGGPEWAFRNSGIMVHCQDPKTMTKDQDFPISIEVQLLGGKGSGERTTANLCTPGTNVVMDGNPITRHCINSQSQTYHGDQWVRVEVEVHGGETVKHIIDGKTVLSYGQPQIGGGNVNNHDPAVKQDGKILTEGWISLQGESHPVEFRKVELLNLSGCMDPKAKNFRSYYTHANKSECRY